jgi:pimeloyl-ACP methyl ester carboxylesterase
MMTYMIEGHANRRGVILPDVGHWVNFEDAGRVDPILVDWFAA